MRRIDFYTMFLGWLMSILLLVNVAAAKDDTTVPSESGFELRRCVLYVDNWAESILQNGSRSNPYHTITRALEVASSGCTIRVLPGLYNEANGEEFPLVMKLHVTLEGYNDGVPSIYPKAVIQGGGPVDLSETHSDRNVTIIGA